MEPKRIYQIKKWLDIPERRFLCPFDYESPGGEICLRLFPKMLETQEYFFTRDCGIAFDCPCNMYGTKVVIARAEEVVKEHEKIQDNH